VPVIYENAFGGPSDPRNPVGRGHKSDELPLVEYVDQQVKRPTDQASPAGFGPIAAEWEPRKSMVGTFGADYVQKSWPGFPADFNPNYYNAAPPDQQVAGYLRGDEEIELENLHPTHGQFLTQLPGFRVICVREDIDGRHELVPLVIDTLSINVDSEQLVLVWRGRITVRTPDALEIQQLGFLVERSAVPLNDASYYQRQLQSLIKQRDAGFEPESPGATEIVPPAAAAAQNDPSPTSPPDPDGAYLKEVHATAASIRANAGRPPEEEAQPSEPPPLSPDAQAKYDEMLAEIEKDERERAEQEEAARWTRDKVMSAVQSGSVIEGADLSNLDLSDCSLTGAHFRRSKLNGTDFSRAKLTRSTFESCSTRGIKFDAANLDDAQLSNGVFPGASLAGTTLRRANLTGADLSGARLDNADLTDAHAEQAIFTGASLTAAVFARANLASAILSSVKAAKANFSESQMAGAVCNQGDFEGARFAKADLRDASFSDSGLNGANFDHAVAADADFTQARLEGASFIGANCEGMWLSSAKADRAVFRNASCTDLQLDGTSAQHADFSHCNIASIRGGKQADLFGANFTHSHGAEPIFETCQLAEADFSYAELPGASFAHASLMQANLTAAELSGARFDYANCQGARFAAANLFQAVFAGTKLDQADISDANFYGVEFLDAQVSDLRITNCNLKMTKLETWAAGTNRK
jgi:uncharacterized protein YjbI with pentapeptide repeats